MFIFYEKGKKVAEIYGPKTPIGNLYGQIVDVLGIGSGCNMAQLLMAISECEIRSPRGCSYFAWIKSLNPGIIEIWYVAEDNPGAGKIIVSTLDADKTKPDYFKKEIKNHIFENLVRARHDISVGISAILLPDE